MDVLNRPPMKYFSVTFPNYVKFILYSKEDINTQGIAIKLSLADGLYGYDDKVYNTKQFLQIESITSVSDSQKQLARNIEKVLF